jgi:hypothetical protein
VNTMIESGDWDFNENIEKFWRERFADQIEQAQMRQYLTLIQRQSGSIRVCYMPHGSYGMAETT